MTPWNHTGYVSLCEAIPIPVLATHRYSRYHHPCGSRTRADRQLDQYGAPRICPIRWYISYDDIWSPSLPLSTPRDAPGGYSTLRSDVVFLEYTKTMNLSPIIWNLEWDFPHLIQYRSHHR